MPGDATEVADVRHLPPIPEHGMDRAEPSDRLVADAADADDLAAVVDRCRRSGRSSGGQWELPNSIARAPHDRTELKDLRRDAARVVDGVLGPAHDPARVVGTRSETVRTAERGQRRS